MWKEFVTSDPKVTLIASDMDGTLLDENSQLSSDFWPLLDKMEEKGILFVPASGRQYASLTRIFPEDKLGFIAENGNLVMLRGKEVFSSVLDPSVVHEAITKLREVEGRNFGPVVCGKHVAFTERSDEAFLSEARKYYANLQVVPDLLAVEEDCLKIAIFDFESSTPIYDHLEYLTNDYQVVLSSPHWVDVMGPGVTKGTALKELQERIGSSREETMIFGDFHNDLPMFEEADHTFAVENGHSDVHDVAKYVIPPNTENGVLQVLGALLRGSTDSKI